MTTADTVPAPPITEARIASPWIVAVPNQKGGVGKTTMALALAAVIEANRPRMVVDVDPQSSRWIWRLRACCLSRSVRPGRRPTRLRELRAYDMVIIDCPGSLEGGQILAAVLAVADFAVIPFIPDPMAIRPTVRTAKFVAEHGCRTR